MFRKFSLEIKLFILFVAVGLVPIVLTVGFCYLTTNRGVALILTEVLVPFVILTSFALTRYISKSIDGFSNQLLEVITSNQELSRRTHEQAATLEELASTIEEVNASIHQTSGNSEQAKLISQSTLEAVKAGEKSIQETLNAMGQISVSSKQIVDIIEVVNDISSQTNILAINAAVEAARAGEQGKGFAIVASEIKNLARRTGESSKEIEKLIKESVDRVERGHILVRQSADILRQIVTNTVQTTEVVSDVAATMREQALATQQMEFSVDQLNQITQQNAAMVEELFSLKTNETSTSEQSMLKKAHARG